MGMLGPPAAAAAQRRHDPPGAPGGRPARCARARACGGAGDQLDAPQRAQISRGAGFGRTSRARKNGEKRARSRGRARERAAASSALGAGCNRPRAGPRAWSVEPARAAGSPAPHRHLLITPAPAKPRTCAEGARWAVRARAMHAGTPRRSGASSGGRAELGLAAVLTDGAPTWPRRARGTAAPPRRAHPRRRRARCSPRAQASRSPRCPIGRGDAAGSFSADVHGALMVAWVGAVGRGPVAAGLLGSSPSCRRAVQRAYVVRAAADLDVGQLR